LTASDVAQLQLGTTRLAYLSACATDEGPIFDGEGPLTLSRAFFTAGVPVVIGTLWPVDDAVARTIAVDFYTELKRGRSPAAALREAQLRASTQRDPVRADWAAFRVVGGGVSPP
jgi:CHAT domain-containing protein